jgi:N-acetyl-gamma-glutamyl-phosphate reductase common form
MIKRIHPKRIGVVGARGFAAEEFLKLAKNHNQIELSFVGSRSDEGAPVDDVLPSLAGQGICFTKALPENIAEVIRDTKTDLVILAVPNGAASGYVDSLQRSPVKILDLSYDYRFDDKWVYGLTECNGENISGAKHVSNPGCYATGAQLGLAPLVDDLVGAPTVFGVSGFSGAGKTSSPKNDPARLEDNMLPYALNGHGHEKEISHHLGHEVRFIPHVASWFRGISLTIAFETAYENSADSLLALFHEFYDGEPLIKVQSDIPEVRDIAGTPYVTIGGFSVDERNPHRATLVVTIDNLLKGAASQAMQNINLMFGFDELKGINK